MNPEYPNTHRPIDAWIKHRTLARIAEILQPVLRKTLEGDGPARSRIKDLLHGTPLGHPLHPLLTDVPIGAWTVTALCDGLEVCGGAQFHEASDVALTIGIAGACGAAIAGLADWSDTKDEPQRLGMLHALANGAALSAYVIALVARRRGARGFGIATALCAYAGMTFAAYLGGELSTGMQLGVKHTTVPVEPPDAAVPVAGASALQDGIMHAAEALSLPVLLTRRNGVVSAISGVCTHRGAALAGGSQEGACVRCPWHGSRFALDDGRVVEGPATFGLAVLEASVTDGMVAVRVPGPAAVD